MNVLYYKGFPAPNREKTREPKGSTAFFILLVGVTLMVLVMIRSFLGVIFFSLTLVFI